MDLFHVDAETNVKASIEQPTLGKLKENGENLEQIRLFLFIYVFNFLPTPISLMY